MHSVIYTLSFGVVSTLRYVKTTKMTRSGAIEESMHRIGALDTLIEEEQRRLRDLDGRFNRFVAMNEVNTETTEETMKARKANMEARFGSLESTLTLFIASIQNSPLQPAYAESSGSNQNHLQVLMPT